MTKNLTKRLAFFAQTTANFWKTFYRSIGFWKKRHFFRRKLSKIAECCDHIIDPWLLFYLHNIFAAVPLFLKWQHKHWVLSRFWRTLTCTWIYDPTSFSVTTNYLRSEVKTSGGLAGRLMRCNNFIQSV
jgi:hypothetical protein